MSRRVGVVAAVLAVVCGAGAGPASADIGTVDVNIPFKAGTPPGCVHLELGNEAAQVITAGRTGTLTRVTTAFSHLNNSPPAQPVKVDVREVISGSPSASVLATQTVAPALLGGTLSTLTADFATPASVTAGVQYAIVMSSTSPLPGWNWCGGQAYAGGNSFFRAFSDITWSQVDGPRELATYVADAPTPDTTDPTITLTTPPDEAVYTQSQVVNAAYSCADEQGGSGLASCVGEVPNGSPIDTSTLGEHLFTVNAADLAENSASTTHKYTVVAAPPEPVTRFVDDDKAQCPAAAYTSIQSAVTAAGPGDTINVCRGTYTEAVTVGAGKDNLTLNSYTAPVAAVVKGGFTVSGAQGVSILKFRIEPPAGGIGVSVGAGSSTALIRSNLVVGGAFGVSAFNASAGTIRDNSLNSQTVVGVSITGQTPPISGQVLSNTIVGTPASTGVYVDSEVSPVAIQVFGNTISKAGNAGVIATGGGASGTLLVKANSVSAGGRGFVFSHLPAAVENNNATGNTGTGISVDTGGYTFSSNNAKGNGGLDCVDTSTGTGTAGTGNTWTANYGYDWNVAGICKKG